MEELTTEEQQTVLAAMLDLAEEGKYDELDAVAELAKDPAKYREVTAGEGEGAGPDAAQTFQ